MSTPKPYSAFDQQGINSRDRCTGCGGNGAWLAYDKHCYCRSKTSVCPLCRGSGSLPDYPEPFPTRPPSHYLIRYASSAGEGFWCSNSSFCMSEGHMPVTTMVEILKALVNHGDTWKKLSLDQVLEGSSYFSDNRKHGEFHVKRILPWSHESRKVATFASEWRDVFYWEDGEGIRMKVRGLNALTRETHTMTTA